MAPILRPGLPALVGSIAMTLLSSCRALRPVAAVSRQPAAAGAPPAAAGVRPAAVEKARAIDRQPVAAGSRQPLFAGIRPPTADRTDHRPPAFATDSALAQRLKAVVEEAVSRGVTRRVGVAVYDLATSQGAGLNVSRTFRPASVIKLAVLVAAYRARPHIPAAQFKRLRPDLERMITISDNAATRRLVRRLGAQSINAAIRELGVNQFRVGESGSQEWMLQGSKAAPADTAFLLAKIARREVVSREACDEMLALLGAQQRRQRIPAGLPAAPDLWVGNKTGTLNGVVNDAGIVLQPPKGIAYTLAIFTTGTRSEAAGDQLLADLSAVVYGYMATLHHG
jgi:beta-lactamase class A